MPITSPTLANTCRHLPRPLLSLSSSSRSELKGEPLARETASKTDETTSLSWQKNHERFFSSLATVAHSALTLAVVCVCVSARAEFVETCIACTTAVCGPLVPFQRSSKRDNRRRDAGWGVCGALQTSFKGRVFMTHATKAIYHMMLSDFIRVSKVHCSAPGSLQGKYRAGGRVHTPSRVVPPVGRHQLPQGSSTYFLSHYTLSVSLSSPTPESVRRHSLAWLLGKRRCAVGIMVLRSSSNMNLSHLLIKSSEAFEKRGRETTFSTFSTCVFGGRSRALKQAT